MSRQRYRRVHSDQHLDTCFGMADEELRRDCPCPEACKRLCAAARVAEHNAPRIFRSYGGRRPFTPIPNSIIWSWGERDPPPTTKIVYLGLIAYARMSNWILDRTEVVARRLGHSPKTFSRCCAELQSKYHLILRVPMRLVSLENRSNHCAIFLRPLPKWFPGHMSDEALEEYERSLETGRDAYVSSSGADSLASDDSDYADDDP